MRILYGNASFHKGDTRGRNAHIGQFITQATALGHELWAFSRDDHAAVQSLPRGRMQRLQALRSMDALYFRLQERPPELFRYTLPPYRQLIGSPAVVWEFNTVPEFAEVMGRSQSDAHGSIERFRRFGQGCDLAICVSDKIAGYARDTLGLRRVVTVPNASDPDLFRPDASPVRRVARSPGRLNVVWIGSAELSWHNFDLLRLAAERLWEQGQEQVAFHVIGQQMGRMRDMPGNVHYYGAESYERLPGWLAAMDVGLCLYRPGPADYNSPLKLFDYMASGLAVVGTFQPQVCDVLGEIGGTDLLVSHDDAGGLADLLLRLAGDREKVRRLGLAGRQRVVEQYNWRTAVARIFTEIQSVLQDRRSTS